MIDASNARALLSYESATGALIWLVDRTARAGDAKAGDRADRIKARGYPVVQYKRRYYTAHRVIWLLVYGRWPTKYIDHINGDKTDNRLSNLREADDAVNSQNQRKPRRDSTTGFLGVSLDKTNGKFKARLRVNGRSIHLGAF